jgi:hypothetical protein
MGSQATPLRPEASIRRQGGPDVVTLLYAHRIQGDNLV